MKYEDPHFHTVLVSLSQVAKLQPEIFHSYHKAVVRDNLVKGLFIVDRVSYRDYHHTYRYRTTSNIRTCIYKIKPKKDVASTANAIRACAFIVEFLMMQLSGVRLIENVVLL